MSFVVEVIPPLRWVILQLQCSCTEVEGGPKLLCIVSKYYVFRLYFTIVETNNLVRY